MRSASPRRRADLIQERLTQEVEAYRAVLDSDTVLESCHFLITFDRRTGTIEHVVFRLQAATRRGRD